MAKYKKQHILPKSYLLGFCEKETFNSKESDVLWIYDKVKGIKKKGPENATTASNYYSPYDKDDNRDHTRENKFNKLETRMTQIFNKVKETAKLLQDTNTNSKNIQNTIEYPDRLTIIQYVIMMLKRSPLIIEYTKNKLNNTLNSITKIKFSQDMINTTTLNEIDKWNAFDKIECTLKKRTLHIIFSKNAPFITSDYPFVDFMAKGYGNATKLYFPLTKNCLLVFEGADSKIKYTYEFSKKEVRQVNILIASYCHKKIICNSENYLNRITRNLKFEKRYK
jgi:hypothetical protein